MAEGKFYRCRHCGNLVYMVDEQGPCVPHCCGDEMELLVPGSVDAAAEKHVPALAQDGDLLHVTVGEVEHPMLENHYIEWVALVSDSKTVIKRLHPGDRPAADFHLPAGGGAAVYAYCNLHGLWKAEVGR